MPCAVWYSVTDPSTLAAFFILANRRARLTRRYASATLSGSENSATAVIGSGQWTAAASFVSPSDWWAIWVHLRESWAQAPLPSEKYPLSTLKFCEPCGHLTVSVAWPGSGRATWSCTDGADAYVRGLATHMKVVRSTSTKYLDGADIKASFLQCAKIEFLLWKHSPCRRLLPALQLPYVWHKSPDPQIPIATSCFQHCASLFPLTRDLTLNPLQSWWYFCWLIISFGFLGWDSQDVHGVLPQCSDLLCRIMFGIRQVLTLEWTLHSILTIHKRRYKI